jgi:sulfatase maturation enzyme AslB (radical SAM superfamily)
MNLVPTDPLSIRWINLEFASACNLRCKWCSLDHDKPKTVMTPELLEQVLVELVEDRAFQLDRIELHNGGETLMHPQLAEMLGVLRRYRDSLPEVHLLTNAGLLTEERAQMILDSESIAKIRFSIDGGTRETFEELRAPAKWSKIFGNVQRFLELNSSANRSLETGIVCLVAPDRALETTWMEPEFRELFAQVDQLHLRWPHNWDGSEDLGIDDSSYRKHAEKRPNKVCYFLEMNLVVLPGGDVTVCCADLNSRGVIGNITGSSLREVYLGAKRREMLEKFVDGRKHEIDLCEGCTGYYL